MTVHEERAGPREGRQREFLRRDEGDRVRTLTGLQATDPFFIPDEMKAKYPDLDFNWKNYEVFGQPDYQQRNFEERQGWRACPYQMFPGLFAPPGTPGYIVIKDMVLMERPMHLTIQARNEEIARANQNMMVNQRMAAATPQGQAPRLSPQFASTPGTIEIPEE